jgi:hypothetical protein
MPKVYSIDGIVPVVHPSAFVHESAVLVGAEALTAIEPGRKRIDIPGAMPLSELKARKK